MRPRGPVTGGLTIVLALLAQSATARGQLQAGPTMLEIGPDATSTRLILGNTGDAPVAAQVRVYDWSQSAGEDRLEPSEDLAASPPILELAPGGEQLVRIVRLGEPASGRDRSYRVVVDELPRPAGGKGSRVQLRMRYVVPLFLRAAEAAAPELACGLEAGGARLACENRGGRAAQLGASRLLDDGGRDVELSDGLFGYVLPGSRRVWPLPAERPAFDGPGLRLETRLNGRPTTLDVDSAP